MEALEGQERHRVGGVDLVRLLVEGPGLVGLAEAVGVEAGGGAEEGELQGRGALRGVGQRLVARGEGGVVALAGGDLGQVDRGGAPLGIEALDLGEDGEGVDGLAQAVVEEHRALEEELGPLPWGRVGVGLGLEELGDHGPVANAGEQAPGGAEVRAVGGVGLERRLVADRGLPGLVEPGLEDLAGGVPQPRGRRVPGPGLGLTAVALGEVLPAPALEEDRGVGARVSGVGGAVGAVGRGGGRRLGGPIPGRGHGGHTIGRRPGLGR